MGHTCVQVIDDRPAVPQYKVKKKDEGDKAIELTLNHLGIDTCLLIILVLYIA